MTEKAYEPRVCLDPVANFDCDLQKSTMLSLDLRCVKNTTEYHGLAFSKLIKCRVKSLTYMGNSLLFTLSIHVDVSVLISNHQT